MSRARVEPLHKPRKPPKPRTSRFGVSRTLFDDRIGWIPLKKPAYGLMCEARDMLPVSRCGHLLSGDGFGIGICAAPCAPACWDSILASAQAPQSNLLARLRMVLSWFPHALWLSKWFGLRCLGRQIARRSGGARRLAPPGQCRSGHPTRHARPFGTGSAAVGEMRNEDDRPDETLEYVQARQR